MSGGTACAGTLRRHFYAAVDAAGLRHLRERDAPLRFHDLRHGFASRAVKVKPLSDVQALLGHAHMATTMRYVHHVPGARDAELLATAFDDDDELKRTVVSQPLSRTGDIARQRA